MALCAIVLLNLCLAADGLASARIDRAVALVARAEYSGFSVETGVSDVAVNPRRSGLTRACVAGTCAYYHQYCGAVDAQAYCQLQIAGPTGGYQRVTIRAASRSLVDAARGSLRYQADRRGRPVQIPLSAMTRVSNAPQPPACGTAPCG